MYLIFTAFQIVTKSSAFPHFVWSLSLSPQLLIILYTVLAIKDWQSTLKQIGHRIGTNLQENGPRTTVYVPIYPWLIWMIIVIGYQVKLAVEATRSSRITIPLTMFEDSYRNFNFFWWGLTGYQTSRHVHILAYSRIHLMDHRIMVQFVYWFRL